MSEKKPHLPAQIAGIDSSVIAKIEDIQQTHSLANLVDYNDMQKSFMIAQGIGRLTETLMANEGVVKCLMYLQGKKMGFRTDKVYEARKVVECSVEALMRGLQLTGNQFNIIADNLYIPKEGFEHLIQKLEGLVDFFIEWGDYENQKGTAKVNFKATWSFKGVADEMSGQVPVRVNSGMMVDAIYGKAERKVMARVYKKVTNSAAYFEERDASEINTAAAEHKGGKTTLLTGDGKISDGAKEPGKWNENE